MNLKLDEEKVDFKSVENHLKQVKGGNAVQVAYSKMKKSNYFKNLEGYRNCSTHRRHIYIEEIVSIKKSSAGYETTATGPTSSVVRYICDNPLHTKPTTTKKRQVPFYLLQTMQNFQKTISKIVKTVAPEA